jgi:hypothetical protein
VCHSTNKKHFFNDQLTKGILFYGTGISPQDLPLPRNVNHEWGLFHEESPLNNYILSQNWQVRICKMVDGKITKSKSKNKKR